MLEDWDRERLHIVEGGREPAAEQRAGSGRQHQGLCRAGAWTPGDLPGDREVSFARTRPADKIENGLDHTVADREPAHQPLRRHEILGRHRRFCLVARIARRLDQNPALGRAIGIGDIDLHQKAIELGLGQGIGAFLLQRILRREHMEGAGQIMPFTGDGDVIFLHRLKQRGLGSRTGPVDFVGHEQLRENGSPHKAEAPASAGSFFKDFGAKNIGGHQVRRELDTPRIQAEHNAERFDKFRFGETWHTDKQAMAARKKGDQSLFNHLRLAKNDGLERAARGSDPLKRGLGCTCHGGFKRSRDYVRHMTSPLGVCA